MAIDIVKKLIDSGEINKLIESKIISSKIIEWVNVYESYVSELNITSSRMQAAENVSINKGVSVEMIYYIAKKLK